MCSKREMFYYSWKHRFGFCVYLSLLSYPTNAKVLNFSTLLPFEAYIQMGVWRSEDSLCCLSDILWEKVLQGARLPPVGTLKTSKRLSNCSAAQRKKCPYCFLAAFTSSLSEEAHLAPLPFLHHSFLAPSPGSALPQEHKRNPVLLPTPHTAPPVPSRVLLITGCIGDTIQTIDFSM